MPRSPETELQKHLEVLRRDCDEATRQFYVYIALHNSLSKPDLAKAMNHYPVCWGVILSSLEASLFIVSNRIFDNKSRHNLGQLFAHMERNPQLFTRQALEERKLADTTPGSPRPTWLDAYLDKAYYADPRFLKRLERYADKYQSVYIRNYADVRHRVHSHSVLTDVADVKSAYRKTNLREFARILMFVRNLYDVLWQLLFNGTRHNLKLGKPSQSLRKVLHSQVSVEGPPYERAAYEAIRMLENLALPVATVEGTEGT